MEKKYFFKIVKIFIVCNIVSSLSGCFTSVYDVYEEPSVSDPNISYFRFIGDSRGMIIIERNENKKWTGYDLYNKDGLNDLSWLGFTSPPSRDIGIVKLPYRKQDYEKTFYEIRVKSGVEAGVSFMAGGCRIGTGDKPFITEKGAIYEFRVRFLGNKCYLYRNKLVYDEENQLYIQYPIEFIK